MDKILHVIDTISEWTGRIFSWIVLLMTSLIVYEVICRRFLNAPTIWNFEVLIQLYGFYFMILASYGLLHKSHVAIDFLYQRLKPRTQAILDIISYTIFFFPFCGILLWKGSIFANTSWTMLEKSRSVLAAPLYPIKTVIPLTAVLLILQGLSIYIKRIKFVINGGEDV